MKNPWAPWAVAALVILIGAAGIRAENRASLEELFKWGEYDSLIHALEPRRRAADGEAALHKLSSRTDSIDEAKARLYLGVAYWATGRREEGTRAFAVATRLNPGLKLDPFYATAEMSARYDQIAEAVRRSGLAVKGRPDEAAGEEPMSSGNARQSVQPKSRAWAWWTGAAALAASAAAGTYLLTRPQDPPKETVTVIDPYKEP